MHGQLGLGAGSPHQNAPQDAAEYAVHGYASEITGCRDDLLAHLTNIPYGQHIYEFILPSAFKDDGVLNAAAGNFLFLRDWDSKDHPESTIYATWDNDHQYYGIGGKQTASYDALLQAEKPAGRYNAADVGALNSAFDATYKAGGISYAMWHADRYSNSTIYSTSTTGSGTASTLMQHLAYVSNHKDVWYVANGWLYSYRTVAERVNVAQSPF